MIKKLHFVLSSTLILIAIFIMGCTGPQSTGTTTTTSKKANMTTTDIPFTGAATASITYDADKFKYMHKDDENFPKETLNRYQPTAMLQGPDYSIFFKYEYFGSSYAKNWEGYKEYSKKLTPQTTYQYEEVKIAGLDGFKTFYNKDVIIRLKITDKFFTTITVAPSETNTVGREDLYKNPELHSILETLKVTPLEK